MEMKIMRPGNSVWWMWGALPPFKTTALIPTAASSVVCWRLSVKPLSRSCPLPKGAALPKVTLPSGPACIQWLVSARYKVGTTVQDHPAPELPVGSAEALCWQPSSASPPPTPFLFPSFSIRCDSKAASNLLQDTFISELISWGA